MPLYEYKCKKCGNEFEELVYSGKPDDIICPGCGAKKVDKKMSSFSADITMGGSGGSCSSCCGGGSCGMTG